MSLDTLEVARAQYLWTLHRQKPALDDQIKDLARVFGALMHAETLRKQAQGEVSDEAALPPAAAVYPVPYGRVACAHQPSPNGVAAC